LLRGERTARRRRTTTTDVATHAIIHRRNRCRRYWATDAPAMHHPYVLAQLQSTLAHRKIQLFKLLMLMKMSWERNFCRAFLSILCRAFLSLPFGTMRKLNVSSKISEQRRTRPHLHSFETIVPLISIIHHVVECMTNAIAQLIVIYQQQDYHSSYRESCR
jgi:hypothetical protein